MSAVGVDNKRSNKSKKGENKTSNMNNEEVKEEESDVIIDESGMFDSFLPIRFRIEFDIFSDNEEKKNNKKRKHKTTSRKLWT